MILNATLKIILKQFYYSVDKNLRIHVWKHGRYVGANWIPRWIFYMRHSSRAEFNGHQLVILCYISDMVVWMPQSANHYNLAYLHMLIVLSVVYRYSHVRDFSSLTVSLVWPPLRWVSVMGHDYVWLLISNSFDFFGHTLLNVMIQTNLFGDLVVFRCSWC